MEIPNHQRIDFAKEQFDVAIELFLNNRSHIAALSLAGVAEEIFGKALKDQGKKNALKKGFELQSFRDTEQYKLFSKKEFSEKIYINERNQIKNSVKHFSDNKGQSNLKTKNLDLKFQAKLMIIDAAYNYEELGLEPTKHLNSFNEWFYETELNH
jgi:hypothetical protein